MIDWVAMSEREYFANVAKRPSMFFPGTGYRAAICFLEGYGQSAARRGGSWLPGWQQWLHQRVGETGNLGWIAHVLMLVGPDLGRRIDSFTAEENERAVARLFQLIDEYLALRESEADDGARDEADRAEVTGRDGAV
ncbi:hypothetical protein [Yinghuangia aomiensis]